MSGTEIYVSRYQQDGLFRARCHAAGCGWNRETKTSPLAAAKRHVEETGHDVGIYRSQYKAVFAIESPRDPHSERSELSREESA